MPHFSCKHHGLSLPAIVFLSALNPGMSGSSFAAVSDQDIINRIKPVGELNIIEPKPAAPSPASKANATASTAANGASTFEDVCQACHGTGILGAPIFSDAKSWAPHIAKGMPTLVEHAIKGFNDMPPKGGDDSLSDDDIRAAVSYMVENSLPK